jgi:glycerol-3-phosphate acyltransferase PlsX
MPLNFVGNVEGDSIFEMVADVVITDGFTGNVILKTSEGLAKSTIHWLKDVISKNPVRMTSAVLLRNAFRELKAIADSEEFGGAPLLGIDGICIIGHGASQSKGIKNAIRVAGETVKYDLNGKITMRLHECNLLPEEK